MVTCYFTSVKSLISIMYIITPLLFALCICYSAFSTGVVSALRLKGIFWLIYVFNLAVCLFFVTIHSHLRKSILCSNRYPFLTSKPDYKNLIATLIALLPFKMCAFVQNKNFKICLPFRYAIRQILYRVLCSRCVATHTCNEVMPRVAISPHSTF